jgi:D-glycero-alpha-D-manno-heptose 1-phosphate guanylyltransferase
MKEAIILAGGLGTRLRNAVPDLPKCMAPVAGRPFLAHVIEHWRGVGITRFIFSLGYMHEVIEAYLETLDLTYACVVEEHPLGTGGAIQAATQAATTDNLLITNGDTLFKVDAQVLAKYHHEKGALVTLALKPMHDFDRYGVVNVDKEGRVKTFEEKKAVRDGLINGGVYILRKRALTGTAPFSFEKDYLEPQVGGGRFFGYVSEAYFIDIGIPEDYNRAQKELL